MPSCVPISQHLEGGGSTVRVKVSSPGIQKGLPELYETLSLKIIKETVMNRSWRDSPVVKDICCSCGEPWLGFLYAQGDLQLPILPVL